MWVGRGPSFRATDSFPVFTVRRFRTFIGRRDASDSIWIRTSTHACEQVYNSICDRWTSFCILRTLVHNLSALRKSKSNLGMLNTIVRTRNVIVFLPSVHEQLLAEIFLCWCLKINGYLRSHLNRHWSNLYTTPSGLHPVNMAMYIIVGVFSLISRRVLSSPHHSAVSAYEENSAVEHELFYIT